MKVALGTLHSIVPEDTLTGQSGKKERSDGRSLWRCPRTWSSEKNWESKESRAESVQSVKNCIFLGREMYLGFGTEIRVENSEDLYNEAVAFTRT